MRQVVDGDGVVRAGSNVQPGAVHRRDKDVAGNLDTVHDEGGHGNRAVNDDDDAAVRLDENEIVSLDADIFERGARRQLDDPVLSGDKPGGGFWLHRFRPPRPIGLGISRIGLCDLHNLDLFFFGSEGLLETRTPIFNHDQPPVESGHLR